MGPTKRICRTRRNSLHVIPALLMGALIASSTLIAVGPAPLSAAATTGTSLYAWGYNNAGQLGDGTGTDDHSPEMITLASGVTATAISAGTYDSLAIGSDGNLYAWGYNNAGQLGDGTTTDRNSPELITLAPGVTPTAIAAGAFHSLAIGSDGRLYAWGSNDQGELGDGTTTEHDSPEVITLASGVTPTAIAAGYYHSLVIGSDGNLYAWGYNEIGQLGDGTTTEHDSPEVITLASGVTPTAISAVYYHSMAIGSDGNLYAWGDNIYAQLGDGTTTNRLSPEVITLALGVTPTTISAGGLSSLAIGSDGNLYAWGENGNGQLGDGTTTSRGSPERITLASGVTPTAEISAGYDHSLDVGSDGNLYAWGQNNAGQLGDGTTTDQHRPEVLTLASGGTPTAISAGFEHSLAIGLGTGATAAPVVTTQPANQTYHSGGSVSFTAAASGTPGPSVQWQYSFDHGTTWANLSGATSPTFSASGLNGLENGWQVRAVFSNSAGSATSDAATMTLATPPTTTSVLFPSNGATLSGSTLLDASATNATSVEFQLFGGVYGFYGPILCTAAPTYYGWLCSWNTTTVPNGSYLLSSLAFNSGGSAYSSSVNITVSNPPPTTSVVIPSNGATQSGTAALLDASASANVTSVKYELTGGTITDQVIATATPTYYGWLAQWNTTTVPNGTYTLQTVAAYPGGLTGTSPGVNVTVHN
jgi:alpha-tubulin suppressor-like RCC1 family protein